MPAPGEEGDPHPQHPVAPRSEAPARPAPVILRKLLREYFFRIGKPLPHRPTVAKPGERLCKRHQGRKRRGQAALTANLPCRFDARKSTPAIFAEHRGWGMQVNKLGSGAAAGRFPAFVARGQGRDVPYLSAYRQPNAGRELMGASEMGSASIAEAFVRNAERAPEKLCLRFEGEEISYQAMRERAEGFGAGLAAWGLRPGERVALFLGNHPDLLAAYVGTHLA